MEGRRVRFRFPASDRPPISRAIPAMHSSFTRLPLRIILLRFSGTISQRSTSDVYHAPQIPGFNPDNYETKQVFYQSKDGTRVPMFLSYKKGLVLNGRNPTLLYGYGGFNITTSPVYRPLALALLEQGFVFASANIRGGGRVRGKVARGRYQAAQTECV